MPVTVQVNSLLAMPLIHGEVRRSEEESSRFTAGHTADTASPAAVP